MAADPLFAVGDICSISELRSMEIELNSERIGSDYSRSRFFCCSENRYNEEKLHRKKILQMLLWLCQRSESVQNTKPQLFQPAKVAQVVQMHLLTDSQSIEKVGSHIFHGPALVHPHGILQMQV